MSPPLHDSPRDHIPTMIAVTVDDTFLVSGMDILDRMSESLPHRAKPDVLHGITRFMEKRDGGVQKKDIYEGFDEDRKTLRRTLLYGVDLEFLKQEGDQFELQGHGWRLSGPLDFEDAAVEQSFKAAIKRFDPYRNILHLAYERGIRKDVLEEEVLTQSALKEVASDLLGEEVQNREVNVLIKSADAAGIGEYRAGKKGYETRLIVNANYSEFMDDLSENYTTPQPSKSPEAKPEGTNPQQGAEERGNNNTVNESGKLKLTVELEVSDKSEKEIASIVKEVRDVV